MLDRRNITRNLCSDIVELSWDNSFGWSQHTKGVLEDISNVGACIQTEITIPLGVDISLRLREMALEAKVCYCTLIGGGFFVGVEFEGEGWKPGVSGPRHLLSLRKDKNDTATLN